MLRNWVTQFGFQAGDRAGDERISETDRAKFIDQVGSYFGWNPPPKMNWTVEVVKDADSEQERFIIVFMRYVTPDEQAKILGKNYENKQ